jgi:hypothetical protein
MIMDRRERLIHLVLEALVKARELQAFALDEESKAKAERLMERARKSHKTIEALNEVPSGNGKGLDKATLDSALDRLIETMEGVNRELDELLAKARGE